MKYFIANWKANKNLQEAETWLHIFAARLNSDKSLQTKLNENQLKIIIAPPHPFIADLFHLLTQSKKKHDFYKNIHLAAQDISQYEEGSHTGEDTAKSMAGIIDYVILGHSERRRLLNETNAVISRKIDQAKKYHIEPIVCIRNREDVPSLNIDFITYEPVHSIGSGDNEPLEKILSFKKRLELQPGINFCYGGSVNLNDIKTYLVSDQISGYMIGTASQNPLDFYNLLQQL